MILIADSGSTKTDWRLIEKDNAVKTFESAGLNPFYLTEEDISKEVRNRVAQDIPAGNVMRIFFYGAGCSTPEKNQIVANGLMHVFPRATVAVASDLLGAARALFKDQSGLAVILGTGTNTALYNGKDIVMSIPALGYILGDEGSGASFGRDFIKAYLQDELPRGIQKDFRHVFHFTVEDIKHAVYKEPKPNQFFASFTRFISQYMNDPFIQEMIRKGFRELFEKQIMKVEGWQNQKIRFAGSIAYYFKSVLKEIATEYGTSIDRFLKAPIHDLVSYHRDIMQKNQKS